MTTSASIARTPNTSRLWLIAVIVLAVVLRAAALRLGAAHLADDRDDYLLVAQQYVEYGFWTPFKGIPNSFRPPLYPLVVAAILEVGGGSTALGILQLVLGAATVALTWKIGRRLGIGGFSVVAAGFVALDPLLIEYTAFPMTETLFTFLVTLLVVISTPKNRDVACLPGNAFRAAVLGIVFGACALCRPTIWPVVAFAAVWTWWRPRSKGVLAWNWLSRAAIATIATGLVVTPWVVRNWKILGSPVLTTTHGGYTLLLGNNDAYFQQVAARPLLDEWRDRAPDRFQQSWFQQLVSEMDREIGPGAGERAQDRWMYRRAWRDISANPRLFLRACVLRCAEFWNVIPLSPSRSGISAVLIWGTCAGYAIELSLFVVGLLSLLRRWDDRWFFLLVLILNFSLVHLLYWSNMRMRAPLMPLIAVIASRGFAVLWARMVARPQASVSSSG
jgi:Dolichyl-phosphate-mannose-protein mannosyltransferase